MASVASFREGFQEDHAADEQVERVDVAAQREHSEPAEEGDRPARVQDQFTGRGQGGDVLFRPVDQDRIDEGRRDRGSHREPSDGEGERREVPHEVREEAGRHGQERPEQEERRPDPDPIGHPTEDDGGDSRGEREEGEEQPEGEGGAREEEGAEGRCGGRQAVDPALARECEGRPPTDAPQVQGEGEALVGLSETPDQEEIHANDDRREAEDGAVVHDVRQEPSEDWREDSRDREDGGDRREASRAVPRMGLAHDQRVEREPEEGYVNPEAQGAEYHPLEGGKDRERNVSEDHDPQARRHGGRGANRAYARESEDGARRHGEPDDPNEDRNVEGEGLRRAHEIDEPEARRHLVAERLDGEDPEQPSVAATPRSSERQPRRRTDRHGAARRKTTYKETPNRIGGESVYNRFSMGAACGDRLAW